VKEGMGSGSVSHQHPEPGAVDDDALRVAAGDPLDALVEAAALGGGERVLDLGSSTGHVALALAPGAGWVLALDPSPHAVREVRRLAGVRGVRNVFAVVGEGDPLPCPDESLDLVVCRYAAHHLPDLPGALWEIGRVLRPGGRLLVVDTIAPEDRALDEFLNQVEALRDPSHAHDYRLSEWRRALEKLGFRYELLSRWELRFDFAEWVAQAGTPPEDVARLEALFDAAPPGVVEAFRIMWPARSFRLSAALLLGTWG
jgi:SAM-dependent methyltransferase